MMSEDNNLTVHEIIIGMKDESLKQQRLALIQLLINRAADTDCALTKQECEAVFILVLTNLPSGNNDSLPSPILDLLLRLLSNLTIAEANAQQFMDLIASSDTHRQELQSSMEQFLSHNPQAEPDSDKVVVEGEYDEWIDADPWQYMSSALCNLCQVVDGRSFILRRTSRYMERIITQEPRAEEGGRRMRAEVTSLQCYNYKQHPFLTLYVMLWMGSCLFDQDEHWWMVVDLGVVDYILLPLVVYLPFTEQDKKGMSPLIWMQANNPNKIPEPEMDILVMLLECLVLLCQRRGVRDELRKRRVYCVVRNLDVRLGEQWERVTELIYDIVNFLIGDEDQATAVDKYEDSVDSANTDKSAVVAVKVDDNVTPTNR